MTKSKLAEYMIFTIANTTGYDKEGNYKIADVDPIGLSVMINQEWTSKQIITAIKKADEETPDPDSMGALIDLRHYPKTTAREHEEGFLIYDGKTGMPMLKLEKAEVKKKSKTKPSAKLDPFTIAFMKAMKSHRK